MFHNQLYVARSYQGYVKFVPVEIKNFVFDLNLMHLLLFIKCQTQFLNKALKDYQVIFKIVINTQIIVIKEGKEAGLKLLLPLETFFQ